MTNNNLIEVDFLALAKLDKDLKAAARVLSPSEARYMVDAYYNIQEYRMRAANQVRASSDSVEPNLLLNWQLQQMEGLEKHIKAALDQFSAAHPIGEWMRGITGVGPIIVSRGTVDLQVLPANHMWQSTTTARQSL